MATFHKNNCMKCSFHYTTLYILLFIPALSLLLGACDTYNFSHPQPVDKKDGYEFPATFQGNWVDDDSEWVQIGKNHIGMLISEKETIVEGTWPQRDQQGQFVYLAPAYKSVRSVIFDSLQVPVDTVDNYLVNGEHIYEVTEKGTLEQGYHYTKNEDTFTIEKKDTIIVDLGHNALLRDIGGGFWVLNVMNQVIGKSNRWWQLFILEKKNNETINLWYCSYQLTQLPVMFYEKNNNYYFNSKWTAAEMRKLIKQGAFEMCNQLHRQKRQP